MFNEITTSPLGTSIIEGDEVCQIRKFRGARYEESKDLSVPQVAALIRKEIKSLQKAWELPALPVSVRSDRNEIMITVDARHIDEPFEVSQYEFEAPCYVRCTGRRWTGLINDVVNKAEELMALHQRSESDWHSDYDNRRFYSRVNVNTSDAAYDIAQEEWCNDEGETWRKKYNEICFERERRNQ